MSGERKPDYLPAGYAGIKVVDSLTALFNTPFGEANVILYPRILRGDFNNVARALHTMPREWGVSPDRYTRLAKIVAEHRGDGLAQAASAILQDIQQVSALLGKASRAPELRVSDNRGWQGEHGVEKFHVDTAFDREVGRILCCYTAPVTQWIRNEDAVRIKSSTFRPADSAPVYSFRPGDIFRIKSLPRVDDEDKSYAERCFIHRVPSPTPQQKAQNVPRLLWVAG